MLLLRKNLEPNIKFKLDQQICDNLISYIENNKINKLGIYFSNNYEINTIKIIDELLKKNIVVSLPQVISQKKMIFRIINNLNFQYEYFKNIKQPIKKYKKIKSKKLQAIITPVIAYNKQHWRLGYGNGYYDRYFKKNKTKKIIKIGIAYSFQNNENFYHDNYDQQLNIIITEQGVI